MTKLPTLALRVLLTLALSLVAAGVAPIAAQAQQPPQPPEGFVSVDELPPEEQVPAAPLLVAAYVFVVLVLFVYVITVARRIGVVRGDIERLEASIKKGTRA